LNQSKEILESGEKESSFPTLSKSLFPMYTIGDVCKVGDGAHAKVPRSDSGVMYLTSKNIGFGKLDLGTVDFISKEDFEKLFSKSSKAVRRPQTDDILMGIIGTFGNAYQYKNTDQFGISSSVAILRSNASMLDSLFLYYVVSSKFFKAIHQAYKGGSAQGYTNIPTIKRLPIPLPPLAEQQTIAHILGSLDDKIELNRRMNETLESIARTLFKSWFVDFDPVRAKMEGRQPYGMDAETAALFPDGFEDSMLGEIPRGWKVTTIGEVTHIVGGSTPSTKEAAYWDNGTIHWATPKDLSSLANAVLIETERCITETGLQQISSRLLPKGTVLLSSRAPIGYLAIAEIPVAINQGFIALICDKELSNHYILQWLRLNMDIIKGRANGTTFQEISKANFRPIPLVVPCNPILKFFDQQVSNIHEQIVNNLQQNQTLATLRDILLPKLLSGEIRVKDAEKEVETPCGQYFSIKAFQE